MNLTSRNGARPSCTPSRPMPDCLYPPKLTPKSVRIALCPTVPDRRRPATWRARFTSASSSCHPLSRSHEPSGGRPDRPGSGSRMVGLVQLTIIGAGAIGGTIGAHLARDGHDVLLCDTDEAQVNAINRDGLSIEGPVENFTADVRAVTPDGRPSGTAARPARAWRPRIGQLCRQLPERTYGGRDHRRDRPGSAGGELR